MSVNKLAWIVFKVTELCEEWICLVKAISQKQAFILPNNFIQCVILSEYIFFKCVSIKEALSN